MLEIHTQPDQPLSFGFKTNWLAVKSDSPEAVLEKLPLQNIQPANWQSSFQIMEVGNYQSSLQPVFVSPCIRAAGCSLSAIWLCRASIRNARSIY